jgi:alkaline phosphatase
MDRKDTMLISRLLPRIAAFVTVAAAPVLAQNLEVRLLTPPSELFASGNPAPVVSRFLPGQRFDLQATVIPDAGQTITSVRFFVNGFPVLGNVAQTPATSGGLPANTTIATRRAFSYLWPGVHTLTTVALQSDNRTVSATGNFEIVRITPGVHRAKNVIILIGDGMGIAHRTAARIMAKGVAQGKALGRLAMDDLPYTGMVITHSLNSIVTDSSPGAACYSTGNKANNNQQGVFPDYTTDVFDNPRVELIGEYLARTKRKSLGIVTTSDVFDATPGAFGTHTSNRGAGTGICDQYLDEAAAVGGLKVLMGGGRKWFLPSGTPGSQRSNSNDYVLPAELASGWGVNAGALDASRDLIADFQAAGFAYAPDNTTLQAVANNASRLLGLFAWSNMNIALDKIDGRRGASTVVDDYGFPDQPMLDEMTSAALQVLSRDRDGFVLMVEAASIDKQAHNMDTERWILDTIEFDRAIGVCHDFAERHGDTLVIVTADHECAGVNIIGGSRLTDAELAMRAGGGGGAAQLRNNVVGTYDSAGFPRYSMAADGYPISTDVDKRMLIGYAANADRYEDWRTNPLPLRDSQQPFNNQPPLSTYPSGPLNRDVAGNFLVTGQIGDSVAAHTGSDVPVSAGGRGASLFTGVMDNTDVYFKTMQAVLGGVNNYEH